MAKRSLKAGSGPTLDPDRENARSKITNMVEQGHLSPEDLIELAQELQARRKQTETSVVRVLEETTELAKRQLSPEQQEALLRTLKSRFETNRKLHENVKWADVEKALKAYPEKLWSLQQLQSTGGEPDVIAEEKGEFVFGDCSAESPSGRRNVVFDKEAEEYLRKNFPDERCYGNAADMVAEYGVDFMDAAQYRALQKKLPVDKNTWSWLKTPAYIRENGGALRGYRNFVDGVCVRQRDAYDHYGDRGFRAALRVPKA